MNALQEKELMQAQNWYNSEQIETGEPKERFIIENKEQLNWAFEDSKSYFETLITEYAVKQREADPKFKKDSTPFGTICYRKQQPKYTYDDDEVIKYLETNGYDDLYRVKKEPEKAEIKKRFEVNNGKLVNIVTGEVVPGIQVVEREDKLEIKL